MLKVTNALRIVSILVFLGAFFYSYANVPEEVIVFETQTDRWLVPREQYFYLGLIFFVVINAIFMVTRNVIERKLVEEDSLLYKLYTWFMGIAPTFNIFLSCAVLFIGIKNNPGYMELNNMEGILIYAGMVFLIIWLIYFPFLFLGKKKVQP